MGFGFCPGFRVSGVVVGLGCSYGLKVGTSG